MNQRGYTLLEMVITIAIVAMIVVAGGGFAVALHPFGTRASVQRVAALLATARSLAASSGNGATVTFTGSGDRTVVALYPGRPDGGTFGAVLTSDTVDGSIASAGAVGATTFALFVDSGGTGTVSTWTPASGTLPAEPPCPGPLDLTFTVVGGGETHALACTDMVLH